MSDGRSFSLVTGRRIAGAVALVLSVAYTYYAWNELGFGRWHRPGAAIFPIAIGILVAIAAVAVLLERPESSTALHGDSFTLPSGENLRKLVFVLVAFAAYFVAMDYIGHMIASALFLFVAMALLSDKSRLRLAIYAAIIAISFEVFFVRLLQVQMPYGLVRLF
jgi:uncharacterized membrane protein YGL010W